MIINTIQVCLLHWGTFYGIWLCRQKYSLQRSCAISPISVQRTWCSSKQIWKKLAQCSAFLWRISHIFCSSGGLGLSIEESGPKNSKALQCQFSRGNSVSGLTFVSCYLQSFEACTFHDLFNRFWRKKTSFPDNSLWKQKHVCMYLSLENCFVTTLSFHETMSVFWKISPLRNATALCHMYIYTYIYSGCSCCEVHELQKLSNIEEHLKTDENCPLSNSCRSIKSLPWDVFVWDSIIASVQSLLQLEVLSFLILPFSFSNINLSAQEGRSLQQPNKIQLLQIRKTLSLDSLTHWMATTAHWMFSFPLQSKLHP